jgi:hypothetical protein
VAIGIGTSGATAAFCGAAAIVEAERIVLEDDVALWEDEIADMLVETPRPRACSVRSAVRTDQARLSRPPLTDSRSWRQRRRASVVWPTQRSPPIRGDVHAET